MRPTTSPGPDSGAAEPSRTPVTPTGPRSWAARYGQVILRDGIAAIPNALYYYQGALALTAQEVWFASYILAHKWDADLPSPSLNRMAGCSGVDLSWLKRIRRSLTYKGLLTIEARYDMQGRQDTNSYDFAGLFAELEAQIATEAPIPNAIESEEPPAASSTGDSTDNSFSARYGRLITRVGIAAIPRALFTHQAILHLTPQQIWFVGYILAHRWSTELPHPSLVRMAERTGYGVRQLHNIKDSLIAQQYLQVVQRRNSSGGKDSNGYDFSGLLDAITRILQQANPAPAPEVAIAAESPALPPPARRRQIARTSTTVKIVVSDPPGDARAPESAAPPLPRPAEAAPGYSPRPPTQDGGGPVVHKGGGPLVHKGRARPMQSEGASGLHIEEGPQMPMGEGPPVHRVGEAEEPVVGGPSVPMGEGPAIPIGEGRPLHKAGAPHAQGTGAANAPRRGAGNAHKKESDQESIQEEYDSNRLPAQASAFATNELPYSPYIAGVILDYSRELGDAGHGPSNVTQALRLWNDSRLDEDTFVNLLHESRRLVRVYQGKQGPGGIANKMGYYFRTATDLCADLSRMPPTR